MSEDRMEEICANCCYFNEDDPCAAAGDCYGLPRETRVLRYRRACSLFRNSNRKELKEWQDLISIPWDLRTQEDQKRLDELSKFFAGIQ